MELTAVDITVQASSLADTQPSPIPMEVESDVLLPQVQENLQNAEQDISQCIENKDTNQETDAENVPAEDEHNDNELKESILKGILKHEHIYGLDKKSVNFDMDIELIPYDQKDYTVDIQIVKELPKRIVSYRELFKKMAEEEKMPKEKDDKTGEDDEDEPEDTKSFSHLILKEPPIHQSTNDIDVNSFKALKATTGQNEKNEDIANTCQQDASQKENENNSSINKPDISKIVEKGKYNITPVNEFLTYPSNACFNMNVSNMTEKSGINKHNALLNGDSEERIPLDQIILGSHNQAGKSTENHNNNNNNNIFKDNLNSLEMETQSTLNNRRRNKKHLVKYDGKQVDYDEEDDPLFNCGHDYLYSDYNDEEENFDSMDFKFSNSNNDNKTGELIAKDKNVERVSKINSSCQDEQIDNAEIEKRRLQNEHEDLMQYKNNDEPNNTNNTSPLKESKHLNIDITYAHNGPIQDKHHKAKLESIKEEKSFNSSKENADLCNKENRQFEMVNIPVLKVENEVVYSTESLPTSESSNSSKSRSLIGQIDVKTSNEQVSKVNGRVNDEISKRDVGIQTNFDFPYQTHCLLCTCSLQSKSNVQEQNVERLQKASIPSLNSDENIAMLASDTDLDCQEDKSTTDSSEGNFRDFSQSTNLDCSSSLSMESFEMDDNSLRIENVNGCSSRDVSM